MAFGMRSFLTQGRWGLTVHLHVQPFRGRHATLGTRGASIEVNAIRRRRALTESALPSRIRRHP
jgi:hypothetical protein